jgi:2-polyprenyl-3-methyl-5-hydroxy-6-metoxy-1,4-benzoquinol methylase
MGELREAQLEDELVLRLDRDVGSPILCHNSLSITGWAVARTGIASVSVQIAGEELTAACGLPAPDVAAGWPDFHEPGNSRFHLLVDTSDWERGQYPLEVVTTDNEGGAAAVVARADIQPFEPPPADEDAIIAAVVGGQDAMWCDAPALDGSAIDDPQPLIRGWAASGQGVDRVLVTIDGQRQLRAIHGLARRDLRWCFGERAANCGFVLRLDPDELPLGRHEMAVIAVTCGGRAIGVSGQVERTKAKVLEPDDEPVSSPLGVRESDERFVPSVHRGTSMEPEHHVRYGWAAEVLEGREVLDAGCGVGWGTRRLAERASRVVGVDLAPQAIVEARRHYGDRAEFVEGDLLDMPFEPQSFDAVVCFEAIEHLEDPGLALAEMRRVLRPNGLLLVSSPNRGVYPEGNPFHLHELTAEEFREEVQGHFRNVSVFRQQTYVATMLGGDAALALDDPAVRLEANVAKVEGGPPGSELYTVIAAGDGELPPAPGHLVLGGRLDHTEASHLTEMWQERAVKAEVDAAAIRTEAFYETEEQRKTIERAAAKADEDETRIAQLNWQLLEATTRLEQVSAQTGSIQESRSWRFTRPLRWLGRFFRRHSNPVESA